MIATHVADVAVEPWSTDATVVVDVANLVHWVQSDVRRRVRAAHGASGADGDPPGVPLRVASRGLHRVVDLLEHHGVRTSRLLLGVPQDAFPPATTGWRAGTAEVALGLRTWRGVVDRVASALAGRDITVRGLPGLFGATGEHCVDELCVLAAVDASWTDGSRDVIVLSADADVAIAPLLAGPGRILLARRMNQRAADEMAERLVRHPNHDEEIAGEPPAHLRLLTEAMRSLLQPEDLHEGHLKRAVAALPPVVVPTVELVEVDGASVLRNAANHDQVLSTPLEAPPDRTWFERRLPLLDAGVRATAIVDPFGLLATANRCGVPGRVPTAASVAEALEPLALPLPLGQLAVVPDLLDADHGLIEVGDEIGGVQLVPRMRDVLTQRVRRSLVDLDDAIEASYDSYEDDALPHTIPTTSQFARGPLTRIGSSDAALEEKESAVLLAADLLWALRHTDGPVVLMSDRPDLVALLDLMDDVFGEDLGMRGRVTRVALQADPFAAEGIAVEPAEGTTRWPTALLTGRMIVDLLRIGVGAPEDDRATGTAVTEAISYDAVLGRFAVRGLDGRPAGEIGFEDVVQLPLTDVELIGAADRTTAARLRAHLADQLRLHLDLRVPLPSARLALPGGVGLVGASILSARVVGHRDDRVVVHVTRGERSTEVIEARMPDLGAVPPTGADVEIVVSDDGEHCRLLMPDLADVPDPVGRPRPARVVADGRVKLLVPLDPTDLRDDVHEEVRSSPLLGPYLRPAEGDVVMVTTLDPGLVRIVSTRLPWVDAIRG